MVKIVVTDTSRTEVLLKFLILYALALVDFGKFDEDKQGRRGYKRKAELLSYFRPLLNIVIVLITLSI